MSRDSTVGLEWNAGSVRLYLTYMNRCFRLLTALVALLAFGFAGAGQLWASASVEGPAGSATCIDVTTGECAHGPHDSSAPGTPCPSMPAGITSACAGFAAALPAESPGSFPGIVVSRGQPIASPDAPSLLLAGRLFRPPRA